MAMSILTSVKSTQEIKESEWGARGGRVKLTTIRYIQYTIDYDCNLYNIFTIFYIRRRKRERERETGASSVCPFGAQLVRQMATMQI